MEKDFDKWNERKKGINSDKTSPEFKEGQIWFCSIGVNIGHERDGNNEFFERPVLVIKKYNSEKFLGAPMTSRPKIGRYNFDLKRDENLSSVVLSQVRTLDSRRLTRLVDRISYIELRKIIEFFKQTL